MCEFLNILGRTGFLKKHSLRFVTSDNVEWHVPTTIDDVTRILDQIPQGKTHRLVGGNTGRGWSSFYHSFSLFHFTLPTFQATNVVYFDQLLGAAHSEHWS